MSFLLFFGACHPLKSVGVEVASEGIDEPQGCRTRPLCSPSQVWSRCEATDFRDEGIYPNLKWRVSTWASKNRLHSPRNVETSGGMLHLRVSGGTPVGETTTGAEVTSAREDFLYGSFRVVARGTNVPGTVFGWFYYLSDQNEIDIEVLSIFNSLGRVHFTIHESAGPLTHQYRDLGFAPSDAFHEYRFDWTQSQVVFFIDGIELVTLSENVPDQPGRIILNHWTRSSTAWGGGPPERDAVVSICSVEAYTNN